MTKHTLPPYPDEIASGIGLDVAILEEIPCFRLPPMWIVLYCTNFDLPTTSQPRSPGPTLDTHCGSVRGRCPAREWG